MRFGSVCSGIEAASVAWNPIGWKAAWLSEIEPFPCAVLAHHYPDVPNHGDMTKLAGRILTGDIEAPDVFCGGTPCQAFSVAGLRNSLDDARGNLSLTFCEIANAIDTSRSFRGLPPSIIFWENVPGVLSTKDNAFGCFLAGLAGENEPLEPPGGKWSDAGYVHGTQRTIAWRTLDAQYFGLAQRRKRVFVVASSRAGLDPAAVLFEFDGVRRDTAPSREAGKDAAKCLTTGTGSRYDWETEDILPVAFNPTQDPISSTDGTTHAMGCGSSGGQASVAVAVPINTQIAMRHNAMGERTGFGIGNKDDPSFTLTKGHSHAVAFTAGVNCENNGHTPDEPTGPLLKGSPTGVGRPLPAISFPNMQVRRLTPIECERLQGFPDNYTAIPWRKKPADQCPDSPRYKALGNSWAVPVVRWIGQRIQKEIA